jgi:hypothetical protein
MMMVRAGGSKPGLLPTRYLGHIDLANSMLPPIN